jgi:N-acetylglucosaminylphosphatidylinositol deacetylase
MSLAICLACLSWMAILILFSTLLCYAYLHLTESSTKASTNHIQQKRVCLVIAHPDDECMFFGPILNALAKPVLNNQLYVLCLTSGNFYGQGSVRTKELAASVATLLSSSVPASNISCINEPELPDDPGHEWDRQVCSRLISAYIKAHSIDIVLSFDERGVSGHPNHCAVHHTLKSMQLSKTTRQVEAVYSLSSVNLARKYVFLLDLLPSLLHHHQQQQDKQNLLAISSPSDYILTFKAMLCHKSQLMWFRWLYLVSSRYMLINYLDRMD